MFEGRAVVEMLRRCGVTDVVWIPDSVLGTWESALSESGDVRLIRVCREGEAFAIAAGLMLGGRSPVVMMQCTGFFEAGDAFRNVVHDLGLPLFTLVGVRGLLAHRRSPGADTCPIFTEPIVAAWNVPYLVLDHPNSLGDLEKAITRSSAERKASIALLAE